MNRINWVNVLRSCVAFAVGMTFGYVLGLVFNVVVLALGAVIGKTAALVICFPLAFIAWYASCPMVMRAAHSVDSLLVSKLYSYIPA